MVKCKTLQRGYKMQHISEIIDEILVEWAYRVNDGMPDPKNAQHILELRKSMEELNIPNNVIYKVISNIINEDKDDKYVSVGYGHYKLKKDVDAQGNPKPNTPTFEKDDGGNYVLMGDEKAKDKKQSTPDEKGKGNTINMKIDKSGGFESEEDEEPIAATPDYDQPEWKDELRNEDHKTTDSQLNLSVAEAKEQAEKKGEKGVGAGTAESRAGEAAVHYTLRELLKGRDITDIKSELVNVANDKDKILNTKWVNAATNTAQWIHDVYGDDIEEVVWDTPSGRKLIDAEGHGTSSDMFIQTKDGKNIGISLKQTTNVFLLNGGYAKQHDILVESLGETLTPDELENFKTKTSINTYKTGFNSQLTNIRNTVSNDENLKTIIKERIETYKGLSDSEFKKIFDSTKYIKHLDNIDDIISRLPHVKGEEMKFIAKLAKDPVIRKSFPDLYDNLRGEEIKLTQSILTEANSNPNVAMGLKKLCLDGMHIEDILFGRSDKLDEFITLYGNNPAVELDTGVLLKIFNMQDEYEQYLSLDNEGDKEEFKQQLLEKMYDKIQIDIKDGARSGEIKIKHENGEFNLFGIRARTKPIGTSPGLELNQTSFMGNVIKEGTPDVSNWKSSTKKRFVNSRIKELVEEMEDANTEQKRALQEEIEKLRAIL